MRVTVRFFASIREQFNTESVTLELPEGGSIAHIHQTLIHRYGTEVCDCLQDEGTCVAVNHEMQEEPPKLQHGDEIAFFPPITGG